MNVLQLREVTMHERKVNPASTESINACSMNKRRDKREAGRDERRQLQMRLRIRMQS